MDPVPLKSLTNLQMADFTTTCLSFLSHVDINPESTVSIRSVCEDDDYLSIPLILACYAKTIEKQQDASVRELAIDETPDVFTIWADTLSTMSEEDYQFRGFTLKMEHISPTPPWALVFSHLTHGLLSAFPLKYLRSLRVTHIPLSQAEWRDIFGGLCFLQSVTLLRDELDNLPVEFVRALSTENDDVGSGSPTIATLFPALVSLSFDQAFNLELFDLLCSALEARKGLGYPLESLRFKRRPYVDKTYFLEMHQRLGLQCQVP
ncbi:hypothetical protein AX16_004663 [Volvariella volvacea WC 439]|nr:hypothetical protein AX16_004663 [Volvariella volvacea WC 439]